MGQVLDVLKIESLIGLGIATAKLDLSDVVTDVVDEARHDYPDIDFHLSIIGTPSSTATLTAWYKSSRICSAMRARTAS